MAIFSFCKCAGICHLGDATEQQRMSNTYYNQNKSDRHPVYTELWRFEFYTTLFKIG